MDLAIINKEGKVNYKCSCCGQIFDELPLCFGAEYPDFYWSVPEEQRASRVELTDSLCVIDEQHFFVRGRLTIPINDYSEDLVWNVWSSVSEENFLRTNDLLTVPSRITEPPYFGWFQSVIPTYENTVNIKCIIHTQPVGLIPNIEIIEHEHTLQVDQANGIQLEKALNIADVIIRRIHQNQD
jgi:hypothetical protein